MSLIHCMLPLLYSAVTVTSWYHCDITVLTLVTSSNYMIFTDIGYRYNTHSLSHSSVGNYSASATSKCLLFREAWTQVDQFPNVIKSKPKWVLIFLHNSTVCLRKQSVLTTAQFSKKHLLYYETAGMRSLSVTTSCVVSMRTMVDYWPLYQYLHVVTIYPKTTEGREKIRGIKWNQKQRSRL